MDTPPHTPPPIGQSSIDSLHIHYCDFAYEQKGPFRMAVTDISDTTAKTFAELVLLFSSVPLVCVIID